MSSLISNLERLWCRTMHDATMWPIHGRYRCGTCLREYPVPFVDGWEAGERPNVATEPLVSRV